MSKPELSATLEKPELDPDGDETACEIEIDVGGQTAELPLHIVFCIDVSGSMRSVIGTSKLDHARDGTIGAIERLRASDSFGVVAFGSQAATLTSPTSGDRMESVEHAIRNIEEEVGVGTGTDISSGVECSRRLFSRMPSENAVRWIILLTDGQDSEYDPRRASEAVTADGLTIHTVGLGDYDETAVRKTAELTQGNWRHAESAGKIPQYFQSWIDDAGGVVVTNPELVVSPANAAVSNEVYYTVGDDQTAEANTVRSGDEIRIDLADLRRDSSPTVTLQFEVPPHDPVPDVTLATLRLEAGGRTVEESVVGDFAVTALQNPDFRNDEVRVKHALAKVGREALSGDPSNAMAQLEEEADGLDDDVVEEAKRTIQNVQSGDKGAKEDVSKLQSLAFPDDDE